MHTSLNAPLLPKTRWLLLHLAIVYLFLLGYATAQDKPPKLFRVTIKTAEDERVQGILYDVTDSTIFFVPNKRDAIRALRADTASILSVPLSRIKRLSIIRKGHGGRGALIGLGVGLATGFLIGVSTPVNQSASLGGALSKLVRGLAITSAVIGGPLYGALFSSFPRVSLSFKDDTVFHPETKTRLLGYAYRPGHSQ